MCSSDYVKMRDFSDIDHTITPKCSKICLQISFEQTISNVDYSTKITSMESDSGNSNKVHTYNCMYTQCAIVSFIHSNFPAADAAAVDDMKTG